MALIGARWRTGGTGDQSNSRRRRCGVRCARSSYRCCLKRRSWASAYFTRPCSTASRSSAFRRVCQPRLLALRPASTSASMRMLSVGRRTGTGGRPRRGRRLASSASVKGWASGSLKAAAVMAASSWGIGRMTLRQDRVLSMVDIFGCLSVVGLAQADDTNAARALAINHDAQTVADVTGGLKPCFSVKLAVSVCEKT